MNNNNRHFIEYMAFAIVFVLLLFCGFAIFYTPQNKMEFRFSKINISDELKNQQDTLIDDNTSTVDEINRNIDIPKQEYKYYGSESAKDIKRKKIKDILSSRQYAKSKRMSNKLLREPVSLQDKDSNIIESKDFTTALPFDSLPSETTTVSKINQQQYNFDSLNSPCAESEMEYILVLYNKFLKKQFTLVFRRPDNATKLKPEVINVTLPYNSWNDIGSNLTNTMTSLFDAFFGSSEETQPDKTKIQAMITTPCSNSLYSSNSFYIENKPPVIINTLNSNICNSKGGRLPDVLELLSMIKDDSSLSFGNYISSSEIIINNQITPKRLIVSYYNGNINFISSPGIKASKFLYKCVYD